jgi:hypothetical protein
LSLARSAPRNIASTFPSFCAEKKERPRVPDTVQLGAISPFSAFLTVLQVSNLHVLNPVIVPTSPASTMYLGPEFLVDVIGITPIRSILRRATQEHPLTQTVSLLFKSISGRCGVHRRIREVNVPNANSLARLATAPISLHSTNINNERFDIVLKTRQFWTSAVQMGQSNC